MFFTKLCRGKVFTFIKASFYSTGVYLSCRKLWGDSRWVIFTEAARMLEFMVQGINIPEKRGEGERFPFIYVCTCTYSITPHISSWERRNMVL